MKHVEQYLAHKLTQRKLEGSLRQLATQSAPADFFSNDYLGLATHDIISGAGDTAPLLHSRSSGATGSRLISGNSAAAEELEATIAAFHGAEAALLFNSGYDANTGLLACIASRDTTILYDELCHASIIDGIRLAQCTRKYRFAHNSAAELEAQLNKYSTQGPVIVVVETVYSMDGDTAPLQAMAELCAAAGASLVADEAHATGVWGRHGEGLVCALGLQDKVFARVHTFGKALGCHGAAVAGSKLLTDYLINFARPFIYTTALPGHSIATIARAYRYLATDGFTNQPLHELIATFRQRIQATNAQGWTDSHSPIQALIAGDSAKALRMADMACQAGYQVKAILPPTVPPGMARLRVCLHTFNTTAQIDGLLQVLALSDA